MRVDDELRALNGVQLDRRTGSAAPQLSAARAHVLEVLTAVCADCLDKKQDLCLLFARKAAAPKDIKAEHAEHKSLDVRLERAQEQAEAAEREYRKLIDHHSQRARAAVESADRASPGPERLRQQNASQVYAEEERRAAAAATVAAAAAGAVAGEIGRWRAKKAKQVQAGAQQEGAP